MSVETTHRRVSTTGERDSVHGRLRRQLLDSAQHQVERLGGLAVGVTNLSLEDVWRHAGLSRTSAYRVWPSKEAFQLDLLCDLAGPAWQGTSSFDEETMRAARSIVADHLSDLQDPEGRRWLLRETVRIAAERNFQAVTESSQWRSYVGISAAIMSIDVAQRKEVLEALRESEEVLVDNMSIFYADMAVILGFKIRHAQFDFRDLAAAGAAVVEGMALRSFVSPDHINKRLIVEGTRGKEDWHLAAYAYYSVLEGSLVLDDQYDFESAISSYIKLVAAQAAGMTENP